MTLFVASLFLPHTIHFDVKKSTPTSTSSSSPITRSPSQIRVGDYNDPAMGLFTTTPPATTAAKRSYSLDDIDHSFFEEKPSSKSSRSFGPSGPSLSRLPTLQSLIEIAPNEPHSPVWGRTAFFNQPKSRAKSPPPVSILEQGRHGQRLPVREMDGSTETREQSHERALMTAEWSVQPAEQGNGGLRNAVHAASRAGSLKDKIWVGTLGMPTDALGDERKIDISDKLESEYDCLTVFIKDSDLNGHYSHFCKTILWPVFHYQIPDNPKSKAYQDHSWVYYVKINQLFADRIVKNWKRGDVVWIHDYHLLLVPSMIRKKLPDAEIGFFLHIAFPSSEVFRCLAVRTQLLEGLLGANLIGFQTQEYCNHFLQTCNRLLSVEATPNGLQLEDRFVDVATFPIGIDPKSLDLCRGDTEVKQWLERIQKKYAGKRLIVARDKLDHVRGVRQKLLSYELFLNKYPEFRENVVLIQVATSTTEQAELDATVSDIVTRINSQHSSLAHQPLVFLKQDMEQAPYLAMITAADILMITSLREGMNLTSHEFIYCQDGVYTNKKHGSLILSEFTGSSSVFEDELSVNPWDYRQCAEALRKALEMRPEEKADRWSRLVGSVKHHTAEHWFNSFLTKLHCAWDQHYRQHTISIPRLSVNDLSKKYESAHSRLFMLDFEGTLADGAPSSISYTSPQRTIDVLNDLLYSSKNTVYVTSGWKPEDLDNIFRRVPGLGLIAENGCFLKESGSDSWYEAADMKKVNAWKDSIAKILKYYQERTEGSRIEERYCSLVFDISDAKDPQSAARQAADCANHINDACENLNVHAVHFEAGVLIESMDWNKRTAAARIFQGLKKRNNIRGEGPPDFLMVVGNAREDEVVYRWANQLGDDGIVRDVTTVSVSSRNTEALNTLSQGVTGILSALRKLAALS